MSQTSVKFTQQQERPLWSFLLLHLLRYCLIFFLATLLFFCLLDLLPGDATSRIVPRGGLAKVDESRETLGLNQPLLTRYLQWLTSFLQGDLGSTFWGGKDVHEIVKTPLLASFAVSFIVFLALLLVTLPLAIRSGLKGRSERDILSDISLIIVSLPEFLLAILLLAILCQYLGLFPVLSLPRPDHNLWETPEIFVMPILSLWLICSASLYRRVRSLVGIYANSSYVKDVFLSGFSKLYVVRKHLLPSCIYGILQLLAQTLPYLLGGAVVVESVLSFPGLGYTFYDAIKARETSLVMSIAALIIMLSCLAFYLADICARNQERMKGIVS